MKNRPKTTLFLIESLDGKISTGSKDNLDIDKDFKRIHGIKEGLHQYYNLEKHMDSFSLNSGRVMAKIGVNERKEEPHKIDCSFIIVDINHLTESGVIYLAKWVKTLYLATANKEHPAYKVKDIHQNIEIIEYDEEIDLENLLSVMLVKYGAERVTLQTGGTLNAQWLRRGLVDHVSIIIAPCLIGGVGTQSLVGGVSLQTEDDLKNIRVLKLVKCDVLENSYLHLLYDVVEDTIIDAV